MVVKRWIVDLVRKHGTTWMHLERAEVASKRKPSGGFATNITSRPSNPTFIKKINNKLTTYHVKWEKEANLVCKKKPESIKVIKSSHLYVQVKIGRKAGH